MRARHVRMSVATHTPANEASSACCATHLPNLLCSYPSHGLPTSYLRWLISCVDDLGEPGCVSTPPASPASRRLQRRLSPVPSALDMSSLLHDQVPTKFQPRRDHGRRIAGVPLTAVSNSFSVVCFTFISRRLLRFWDGWGCRNERVGCLV